MTSNDLNQKLTLKVKTRTLLGNSLRKLRREKVLPAVVFSNKFPSTNLQTLLADFTKVYKLAGKTHIIELDFEDSKSKLNALVSHLDIDPVKGTIRHVDFRAVDLSQKVVVSVPLVLVGESEAVKSLGAVIVSSLDEIEIECYPDKIPDHIEIDISKLATMDDLIRVSDLDNPTNQFRIISESNQTIVSLAAETAQEETPTPETQVPDTEVKATTKN